jgi:hypothetical protein
VHSLDRIGRTTSACFLVVSVDSALAEFMHVPWLLCVRALIWHGVLLPVCLFACFSCLPAYNAIRGLIIYKLSRWLLYCAQFSVCLVQGKEEEAWGRGIEGRATANIQTVT